VRERDRESEKEGSTMEIAGEGAGEIQRGRDVRMGRVTAGKQNKKKFCNVTQISGHNHVPTQVPDPNPPPVHLYTSKLLVGGLTRKSEV